MKARVRTALGIDLSPRQVSAALVERAGPAFRVVAAASSDLTDSADHARALSLVVKRLGRRARSARTKAAVSLSTNPLVVQILDMPRHMPANIREFVEGELRQYVTLSGKRTVCDFCGIGLAAEGRKRMLTAAAETEPLLKMVTACAKAGVTVEAVEPSLLACARAFHAGGEGERLSRSVLIAILGSDNLTLSLFHDGMLDFVRIRDIPSDAREQEALLEWLAEELRAVIHYHSSSPGTNHGALHVRVILQGPESSAKEVEISLRARTAIESLAVIHSHESAAGGSDMGGEAPCQMAVGAAMKILDPDADSLRINLLPEEVRRARLLARHALLTAIAAALTFLGVLMAMLLLNHAADTAREQVEQRKIAGQLYTTPALIAQDTFLDREISRARQQLGSLQKLMSTEREVDWPGVLNAVRRAAPAGVCITELASDNHNEHLLLKGLALSGEAAQSFVRGLDGSEPFTSVAMNRVTLKRQSGRELVEYQIDCSTKSASGGR